MYEAFFQLKTRPFPSTPRADLYHPVPAVESTRQTLARCIERAEGPGLLIGGPGTGKSLVCALLAEQFRQCFHLVKLDHARFATRRALLQAMMFELNLPYRGADEGELRLALIDFAKAPDQPRKGVLLLIDEAQTLSARLIEEIRMIGNVVVDGQPRWRLVLAGSPELEERLTSAKLESFNQRVAARCYLQPLNYDETAAYVRAQIAAVGGDPARTLTDSVWQAIYHASGGIPRLINQVCDHGLILAAGRRRALDGALVEEAWADLQQLPLPWNAVSQAAASSAPDATIEFGSLTPDDEQDEPVIRRENARSIEEQDGCGARPHGAAASVKRQSFADLSREVIDLTSQLEPHGLPAAELVVTETRGQALSSPSTIAEARGSVVSAARMSDPFADSFDEEEEVRDHYASLEAQSRRQGRAARSPAEHEFTTALEKIFQPLSNAEPAGAPLAQTTILQTASDRVAQTPVATRAGGAIEPADHVSPSAIAALDQTDRAAECDLDAAATRGSPHRVPDNVAGDTRRGANDEASEAEFGDEGQPPATVRVAARRAIPPDDSDLIIVLDAEAHVGQLSRVPGKAHRQEYRRLFTRLREDIP